MPLRAFFLSVLFLTHLAAPTPPTTPASSDPGGAFLTKVEKKKLKKDSDPKEETELIVPTNQKIRFAWTDEVFAIQIPFDFPQTGERSVHELTATIHGILSLRPGWMPEVRGVRGVAA